MVNYIKNYVLQMLQKNNLSMVYLKALREEWNRLDPRDFEPGIQHEVVNIRVRLEYAEMSARLRARRHKIKGMLTTLPAILDQHRGEGSRGVMRPFSYVVDTGLREIIERDYFELNAKLFPSGAWKSTVIMAGSILEAVLHDILAHTKRVAQTNASSKGAKGKGGISIDITVDPDAWKLVHLINVAVDIGILPPDRAATIDQVLRDYRNFVHPRKEIKKQHECSKAEAGLAKYGLDGVCDHLQKTL